MFLKEWKVLVFETDIQTHVTEYGLFRTVICISTSLLCQFEINHIGVSEILNINSLVLFPNFTFKSPIVPLSSRTKQIPNLLASFSNPVLPLVEVLICNTRPGKCRVCVCMCVCFKVTGTKGNTGFPLWTVHAVQLSVKE